MFDQPPTADLPVYLTGSHERFWEVTTLELNFLDLCVVDDSHTVNDGD